MEIQHGGSDSFQQLANRRYVDPWRRGRPDADRLIAEEGGLAAEAEVHRAEFCESADLPEDAGHRSELRLAVHRLDAERTALVDVAHTALRGVELDGQRLREIGMGSDHIRPEDGPTVPFLHGAIAIRPFPGHQVVVDRRVDVAQRDPIERLDERLVVIAESRERSPEYPRAFEAARVMHDFSLANRQAAEVLARHDRARDQDKEIAPKRVARTGLVDGHVLERVAGVKDRARHVSWIGRDVRRNAEIRRLVDVAVEDHDLHGPESMPPSR